VTGRTPEAAAGHSRPGGWIDVVATTVLALAAVATAWIATEPLKNPGAPLTPFAMPQYRLEANVQAERLETAAAAAAAEANRDIQRANDYVLGVVLFSVALFFAGISSRLGAPRARAVILGVGCAVLLGTIAWMATFPISLST
jgi:hypothetical protein